MNYIVYELYPDKKCYIKSMLSEKFAEYILYEYSFANNRSLYQTLYS